MFPNDLFAHRAVGWRPTPRRPFLRAARVSSNRTAVFPQSKRSEGGSILKSRDITLLTKVHVVRAMVFLVVMYGCQSWALKKVKHQSIDAFELWCWRRLLGVLWTAGRSNQSILKEINPEYSLEGLMLELKLQYFGHMMQKASSLEKTWCWERLRAEEAGNRG